VTCGAACHPSASARDQDEHEFVANSNVSVKISLVRMIPWPLSHEFFFINTTRLRICFILESSSPMPPCCPKSISPMLPQIDLAGNSILKLQSMIPSPRLNPRYLSLLSFLRWSYVSHYLFCVVDELAGAVRRLAPSKCSHGIELAEAIRRHGRDRRAETYPNLRDRRSFVAIHARQPQPSPSSLSTSTSGKAIPIAAQTSYCFIVTNLESTYHTVPRIP
jgi:hypothetical protein